MAGAAAVGRLSDLRAALKALHSDQLWWRKVGIGGALMLSLVGYPWVDGYLMQSVENSKRGFPTPLPLWHDWGVRYVIGLLGMLIDLTFFGLPLLLGGLLLFCAGVTALTTEASALALTLVAVLAALVALYLLGVFALGLSPIARLLYAEEGRIEEALGPRPLRAARSAATRAAFARARLASLPAYLPALLLGALAWALARQAAGLATLLTLLGAWLACAALFYARLVTLQLYVNAERALDRRGYGRATR
jgi:hypothetical protein